MAKEMVFLVNPAPSARRAKSKSAKPRKARGGSRRKNPAPNTSGAAGGSTMAGTKRRRGAGGRFVKGSAGTKRKRRNPAPAAVVASNPPRRRRRRSSAPAAITRRRSHRRTRRNPPGLLGDLVPFASEAAMGAVGVLAGKVGARKVRGMMGQGPGTLLGSMMEAGAGIVGGLVLSSFSPEWGARFAIGGVLAPMETLVQQLGVKGISDTLGDDGYLVGADTGVDLVSAYDDGALGDGDELAGYIAGGDGAGEEVISGYVYGAA